MYFNEKYKKDLFDILEKLVSFNSIYDENSIYPFGEENKKCLDYILGVGESFGFKIKNLDDYCGFIEIGSGEKIIGIAAHLDIVPAGLGWKTDPFKLTKIGNRFYGRGTSDDKGAVAASIIALKIINDLGIKLNKRIRLILGCNEESGSKCISHYIEKEGYFDYGFTPDGDFPLINGEKGQIKGTFFSTDTNIIDIEGGTVSNAVPNICIIKIKSNSYNKEKLVNFIQSNDLEIEINNFDNIDSIKVIGKSAHASTPELGKNAISYLLTGLYESGYEDSFIKFYFDNIGTTYDGSLCNINIKDEYGNLTFNVGTIKKENDKIIGTIDIRFPVTKSSDFILSQFSLFNNKGGNIVFDKKIEPLFYELDSKLVTKLYEAYVEVSKDDTKKPLIIGGGTYAKSMKNCVAFGPGYPDIDNHIHDKDEYVDIDELCKQVDYYVTAIFKLLEI